MSEFWFKPKRHGCGATPSHWKGWLLTIAFSVILPAISLPFLLSLTDETRTVGLIIWCAAVMASVWAFTVVAKAKTDGEWMWRWNGEPYRSMLDEEK
jgi:hypothetical protein